MRAPRYSVTLGSDPRLQTETGEREEGRIVLRNAAAGVGLFGGYMPLHQGRYRALVWLSRTPTPLGSGTIDVCIAAGMHLVGEEQFDTAGLSREAPFIGIDFVLYRDASDVEVRIRGADGLTLAIECVELIDRDAATRPARAATSRAGRAPLNILYLSCHEILEFDELRMLTGRGHRVFSPYGYFGDPARPPEMRQPLPRFFHAGDWEDFNAEGMTADFIRRFDLAIVMSEPQWVAELASLSETLPIVYRSIGQSNLHKEKLLAPYADRISVVRYSPREQTIAGYLPADAVIRFSKNLEDYRTPWVGGDRLVTFHHRYAERDEWSTPGLADYRALTADGPFDLYGAGDEGVGCWRGTVSPEAQYEIYRRAALYVYVYTVAPSYTLSFMEAMGSGVPILAPTAAMIQQTTSPDLLALSDFSDHRYEVPFLLDHDPRLLYSSVPEAREKIAWLLANREYCEDVSARLRAKFADMFDTDKIVEQWDELLYGIV